MPPLKIASVLSRFLELHRLRQGGDSAVYAARELDSGRDIVLKLASPGSVQGMRQILAEYRMLARVAHPHVVEARQFGWLPDGLPYLVSDFAGHQSLGELAADLSRREFLRCVHQAVLGLDAFHRLGCIHGDVKPSHLLLRGKAGSLHVSIIDAGLARPFGPTSQITGTLGFVAPEMLRFEAVDQRSDWFSLGMTLLHCLIDPVPRTLLDTEQAVKYRSRWRDSLARAIEGLGEPWEQLLPLLLDPEPANRPATAWQLLQILDAPSSLWVRQGLSAFSRPPFHGRSRQMRPLLRILNGLRSKRGLRLLSLDGEAGCGKTRFLEEFCVEAAVSGAQVFRLERGLGLADRRTLESSCQERPVVVAMDGQAPAELGDFLLSLSRRGTGGSFLVLVTRPTGLPLEETLELPPLGRVSRQRLARWLWSAAGLGVCPSRGLSSRPGELMEQARRVAASLHGEEGLDGPRPFPTSVARARRPSRGAGRGALLPKSLR